MGFTRGHDATNLAHGKTLSAIGLNQDTQLWSSPTRSTQLRHPPFTKWPTGAHAVLPCETFSFISNSIQAIASSRRKDVPRPSELDAYIRLIPCRLVVLWEIQKNVVLFETFLVLKDCFCLIRCRSH